MEQTATGTRDREVYGGNGQNIVIEVDRRSLAGLSIRTNERGKFNNDTWATG